MPGCVTVSKDETDAIKCAKEALGLHIYGMEVDGESIPAPSSIKNLPQKKGTICVLVDVWMPLIRASVKEYSVKKTLTIPAWMDRAAKEAGIKNYSLMLQVAIAQELGIDIKAETPFSHPAPTIA
ncbi:MULTISPECIES: type II toxin-antitoxin system HicB family antitoxin [Aminobacterium]|uniref:type II toxin-antitoxin system HicB family antitoxin n=1 Tax=Aminobacterium TaxID=81466 RepID=UPI00257EEB1E|nr:MULTISPECIES: type II toxin-antitoxin system HicB family antitoxin [unclassified Aminobacterium]